MRGVLLNLCGGVGEVGLAGDVALDGDDVAAGDAGGGLLKGLEASTEDEDVCGAVEGEGAGHVGSEAGASAGDDRDEPIDVEEVARIDLAVR